jgi:hypothetical protein
VSFLSVSPSLIEASAGDGSGIPAPKLEWRGRKLPLADVLPAREVDALDTYWKRKGCIVPDNIVTMYMIRLRYHLLVCGTVLGYISYNKEIQ